MAVRDLDSIFDNLPQQRPRRPGQGRPLNAQDIKAAGGVGTIAPANPSWSERLGGAFANAVDAVRGGGDRGGWQNAYDISQKLASLVPGLGQGLSANEAYRQGQAGNYGHAALAALGAVPLPGARGASVAGDVAETVAREAAPAARTAQDIATGGGRALTDIAPDIRDLPVDQGIAQARSEAHLVPARGGGYVGAPPNIQTYADLQARRAQVDDYIAQHLGGADWYDRARAGIDQATGGDPVASDWLSKLQGSLSAGVSPESETAFAVKEAVSRAAGEPQVAHWSAQSRAIDRAIEANDPALMQFGDKTEEYAAKIGPNQPPFKNATGVNDFRQLKLWGYPGRAEGVEPSAGETQHRFLDYETALTADRANRANLGGRTNWTGEQIQAVPWVTQKAEDLGIPFEQAAMAGPDFYPKHAAAATYEQWPGGSLVESGHLSGAAGATADQRTAFSADDPWTDLSGRDVIYGGGRVANSSGEKTGMGVPTLPTLSATGVWKDETNPARIAQPTVPFNISTKENPAIGGGPLGTKDVPPGVQKFMSAAEHLRSVFGAQEGGGWNKLWEKQAPGAQNAVFVPLDRDATRPEIDALAAAGEPFGLPHVTSTNGGLAVLNYDGAKKLSTKDRNGLLDAINDAKPDDAGDHRMIRANTGFAGPAYTTPGAGTATQGMLDAVGDNPFFTQNAGIGQAAGALARRDQAFADQFGPQRQDFWNLRQLAAANGGEGWAGRLQDALKTGVIPATIGGVTLYPTAGLPAPLPQGQPGTSLNSGPDWWRQMQDQRFGGF